MSTRGETLQLATRGSDLARWQAETVREQLSRRRRTVELVEVETTGDQVTDELIHRLGTTGAFVRSLDEKVLSGELDAAVHSMKDMPTEQPDDLVLAGVPERGPVTDVLVTRDGTDLEDLPEGATVGTSSLRRGAQLLAERPDLDIAGLRGNVDTRVQKLLAPPLQKEHQQRLDAERREDYNGDTFDQKPEEWFDSLREIDRQALELTVDTEYDAICLARAGLERSGLLSKVEYQEFDPEEFVPAPGQGAIAVTARDGETADQIQETLDDPPTRVETTTERAVLAELGGGCVAPVGIYARLQGDVVVTTARILSRDGTEEVRDSRELPVGSHQRAAREFARDLADRGAKDLIEAARREDPDGAKRAESE